MYPHFMLFAAYKYHRFYRKVKRSCGLAPTILCALASFAPFLSLPVNALEPRFEKLLMESHQSGGDIGAVKHIAQDSTGFIWIAAEYGLIRYDGRRATRYESSARNPHTLASNFVNNIDFDNQGNMWLATENGLHKYNEEQDNFTRYFPDPNSQFGNNRIAWVSAYDDQLILAQDGHVSVYDKQLNLFKRFYPHPQNGAEFVSFNHIFVDGKNRIWLGTKENGAAIFDIDTGQFRFYTHNKNAPGSIVNNHVTSITEDTKNRLWFATLNGGLSRLDPGDTQFVNYRHNPNSPDILPSNNIWSVYSDSQGRVWIATDHSGLAVFNEETNTFDNFVNQPYNQESISSNHVRTIFEDHLGDIWVGLFPKGINLYSRLADQFTHFKNLPEKQDSLSHSAVLTVSEDSEGLIWVGTEDGLNAFDRKTKSFTRYVKEPGFTYSLKASAVLDVTEDDNGQLWVATWSGGVHRFDKKTQRFYNYSHDANNPQSLNSNIVWSIVKDKSGKLWMGTEGGGLSGFDVKTETFQHFTHDPNKPNTIDSNYIWTMLLDSQGKIWIGTTAGLNIFDPETFQVSNLNDHPDFKSERIRSLMESSDGRMWIGTQDSGFFIYNPKTNRFKHYAEDTALPSLYVTGFVQDGPNTVWASTTRGLVKINPTTLQMEVYNSEHGLPGENFNREANYIDQQGNIYFGNTDGLTVFKTEQIEKPTLDEKIIFSDLKLLNRPVKVFEQDSPLKKALWKTTELEIPHNYPMFSLEFSYLDYRKNQHLRFAYKLEGFDRHWNDIGRSNNATFTNLNPGNYTLLVKAGTDDDWGNNVASMNISILPPPWKSWWAYCLYALIVGLILYLIINSKAKQVKLASAQKLNEELKGLNEIKDAFLANTSHELRTPLNGIIGISDTLYEYFHDNQYAAERLKLISSSGRRLANLINDILDYSKLANKQLELNIQPIDMHKLCNTVHTLLGPLSAEKNIELINSFPCDGTLVEADENRLQQILINLIGNGIKYSESGSVTTGMNIINNTVHIFVEDTGIGISHEQKEKIFEAFNQVQNANNREYGGTGLGLAITQQLVELHDGRIWVEDGKNGSKFIFSLQKSQQKTAHNKIKQEPLAQSSEKERRDNVVNTAQTEFTKRINTKEIPRAAEDQSILIVDDDAVNRIVLSGILGLHNYKILEATSGKEAINMLKQHPEIDLIIMDVMMPQMTGYEATEIIRQTHPIYQLPIIFITAKRDVEEDVVRCFSVGGNDFLTKPVSKNELLPRIASHLRVHSVIRQLKFDLEKSQGNL